MNVRINPAAMRAFRLAVRVWERSPFVLRRTYDRLRVENFTLRSALHEANQELRNYRRLVGSLREGNESVTRQVQRILKEPRA